MKVLGYHIQDSVIANSDSEMASLEGEATHNLVEFFLDFLLMPKPNTIRIFYNLDYAVAQLLKACQLPEKAGFLLWNNGKLQILESNYTLKYIPGKSLMIIHGHGKTSVTAYYCDAEQYSKHTTKNLKEFTEIILAKEAQIIGQKVYNCLTKLGLSPASLTSPVSTYEKQIMTTLDLPTADDYPEPINQLAYESLCGGWVEAFQRGHWQKCYDYDQNACYPFLLTGLVNHKAGTWQQSDSYLKASDAILNGTIDMTADFHPIIYSTEQGNTTPVGQWDCTLTQKQVELIEHWELGSFKLRTGWFWTPNNEVTYPLKDEIERLYAFKSTFDDFEKDILKRLLAGIWGKLIAKYNYGFGDLFNPFWGLQVESGARLEVARFALIHNLNPIHIAVDGLLSDKYIKINSRSLGGWRVKETPAIVISSGIWGTEDKSPDNSFSMSYSKLKELLSSDEPKYTLTKESFVSLGKAVMESRYSELGGFCTSSRSIILNQESKRYYPDLTECTGSMLLNSVYTSEPWDIDILEGLPI